MAISKNASESHSPGFDPNLTQKDIQNQKQNKNVTLRFSFNWNRSKNTCTQTAVQRHLWRFVWF